MKKNLKLALQASGFVALFALALTGNSFAKEDKNKHHGKDHHEHSEKERERFHEQEEEALKKWQEGPLSLEAAYDKSKGDPATVVVEPLDKVIAETDDDVRRLGIFKIIKTEDPAAAAPSEADKEKFKKELADMVIDAKKSKGHLFEILAEMSKNKSKYLTEDELREIRHSIFEDSVDVHHGHKDKHHKHDKKDKKDKKNKKDKHDKHNKKDKKNKKDKDEDDDKD